MINKFIIAIKNILQIIKNKIKRKKMDAQEDPYIYK
jgi:hypothetical protein